MGTLTRHLTPVRLFGLFVVLMLVWGPNAHLDRYITPQRGVGYWLGIIGGSMMLVLLMYPARKRASWLNIFGGVTGWFRAHMTLGVLGPLIVLFHSDFRLGATNSNVALICMMLVSGSGLVGRYIYSRVFGGWHGHRTTLEELKATAEQLHRQTTEVAVLPELLGAIEAEEKRLFNPTKAYASGLLYPFTIGIRAVRARWRLEAAIRGMVVKAAAASPTLAAHGARLTATAMGYATRRLNSARLVREHGIYVKLFSYWHVLHVPFFIMTLIAGIVHVVAVNIY